MPTLLHISDLHRSSGPRLSNSEILTAIVSDATRWRSEGIPKPDLIVVSGDLIQGAQLGEPDPDAIVKSQYREVGEFLEELGSEFVDSERSRIVIVPGNHDVHWSRSLEAMTSLNICPDRIENLSLETDSRLRWNWKNQQAYEIVDQPLYESRFEHFREFQRSFYDGVDPSPICNGDEDLFFFEYRDLGIVVAGFSSWYGNDCFCRVGDIEPKSLALSQRLLADSKMNVALAVWHHSIKGGPRVDDYMDQRIVHKLIDFGFRVGLHGHQHYAEAAPFELHLPNLTSMIVVGAGSLAVGDNQLPMGERRQFNIIVIDPDNQSVKVHVRGMSPAGVFTGAYRDDFGGATFMTLKLPSARDQVGSPTTKQLLDDAITAVGKKDFGEALALIENLSSCQSAEKRQIEIESQRGIGNKKRLIELFDPPESVSEVVEVVTLLLDENRLEDAKFRLNSSKSLLPANIFEDLSAIIATKEMEF